MPGVTADDGPSVPSSFANNFWGKEDAGVQPILERMHGAKVTAEELRSFYASRAQIEDEYAKKLLSLCRKPLGSCEGGTLRASLDVVRGEVEAMGKAHGSIAAQMKAELDEPLTAFSGGLKERRKIVQTGIEKLHKTKMQQTGVVNKSRDKFEQDCLRIKGYLAQGHMVMGQEERKNKSKLEKTQIQMASNSNEYEAAVKVLEETVGRWNRDWKLACDKFQDFEEERIDFMKSSLWTFANIASTVCVSDDGSCEKIRVSLENCEVEKDIRSFIAERGTGQEIPDAPRYINFNRGDINDSASEASEDEYSVAQFQRSINPAYRTSSPNPSTLESHNGGAHDHTPRSRESTVTPARNGPPPAQPDFRRQAAEVQQQFQQQQKQIELAPVPHNEYPPDGMTMLCRSDNQSDLSSTHSPFRPGSRDTELSNPTSMSSVEPVSSGKTSPFKSSRSQPESPDKTIKNRRSGFFSNSPFRRKSKHEKERPASRNANAWNGSTSNDQSHVFNRVHSQDFASDNDLEPVDPRANFQLNVGNNVFDVASPDAARTKGRKNKPAPPSSVDDNDPIAAALAELKGVTKQSAGRVTADRYAGLATPAPQHPSAMQGRTPPPGYHENNSSSSRLDAPQPAHTAAQMHAATRKYTGQNADMYGTGQRRGGPARSASPLPMRSASPRPDMQHHSGGRSASPNPNMNSDRYGNGPPRRPGMQTGNSPQQQHQQRQGYGSYGRQSASPNGNGGGMQPQPAYARQERPASSAGNYGGGGPGGGAGGGNQMMLHRGDGPGGGGSRRPVSFYGGAPSQNQGQERPRRGGSGQFTPDGRPILHFAKAMYTYSAAIPEELSFTKGDVLAVLRLQDDGWWEAEVTTRKGMPGLVPSNYLQRI